MAFQNIQPDSLPRKCTIDGCDRPLLCRGMCGAHYARWKTHGDVKAGKPLRRQSVLADVCSVEGCGNKPDHVGLCNKHYLRLYRRGSPIAGGRFYGEVQDWISRHLDHQGDDCLIWPFSTVSNGYGHFTKGNRQFLAHRVILEASKGAPPAPEYHAAHECGNGNIGCVNPRHLFWKTASQNQQDRVKHGTSNRGERCAAAILRETDIPIILRLLERGESPKLIASDYGVSPRTIRDIGSGATWSWLTGIKRAHP